MCFESLTDTHRPLTTEVFLDTSIHCCLQKGPLFRERVHKVLGLFRWKGTSSYTKVEFGNVVLAEAEYCLRTLDRFDSLDKALDFIGNVLPHQFHSKKVTWSFNLLRVWGSNDAECTERARHSLRLLMKVGVKFVDRICDDVVDGTKCYWAENGMHKSANGRLQWKSPECRRQRKRCRVDEFFLENRTVFERIKQAIDALAEEDKSEQLRSFSILIGQAMADPGTLLDYRTGCRRLADAIVAVDSTTYKSMFSQNVKESGLLTTVLGQHFYFLPPNPDRGILLKLGDGSGRTASGADLAE